MTRGNQREIDRARAQAREARKGKAGKDGDPKMRAERDAKALQEKIAKKEAAKAGGGGGDGGKKKEEPYTVFIPK